MVRGSSWRLRLGLSRTARRGCARVIGVGGGAGRVGGQGKAWNWWRQSVARRAPQRPSHLAVQFFHLLPYRVYPLLRSLLFSSLLFSSSVFYFSLLPIFFSSFYSPLFPHPVYYTRVHHARTKDPAKPSILRDSDL